MIYRLIITQEAEDDIAKLRLSGDKIALTKLNRLLDELRVHPNSGSGQPEKLKHGFSGCFSRRITSKHRLIYQIKDDVVTVVVISAYGHYGNK